jgi:hypothetical protein
MTERPSTKHNIQIDDENINRPNYAVVTNIYVTGSASMIYTGVDRGTGLVTIFVSGSDSSSVLPITEDEMLISDVSTWNATTGSHGFAPRASAPAGANDVNVLGIVAGNSNYTNIPLFDSVTPNPVGVGAAGTQQISARRDHVHTVTYPQSSIGIMGQNVGIPLGTGTTFNVNGTRLVLSISGTVLNLTNSPEPPSTSYPAIYSDSSFVVTGTNINVDNPLTASVSGSFAYIDVTPYPLMIGYKLGWTNTGTISISAGSCYAPNGAYIDLNSSVNLSPTISGSAWNHVYAYLSTGTVPTIETNAIAPVIWKGTAYGKTGDTSRRYLGSFLANSARNIYGFVHHPISNTMVYQLVDTVSSPFRVLSGGTGTGATAIPLAGAIPITTTLAILRFTNSSNQLALWSENSSVSLTQRTAVVSLSTSTTQSIQGTGEMGTDASQQIWYKLNGAVSGGGAFTDVLGYRYDR